MRTQSELGWLQAQYDDFTSNPELPIFRVELQQYSLSLVDKQGGGGAGGINSSFDAVVVGDVLVRVWAATDTIYVETRASEDAGDTTWSQQSLTATGIDTSVPLSLVTSGNTVRIFWYDSDEIRYFESTNEGASWGASTLVTSAAEVIFLGATQLTRCHYLTLTGLNNVRFHVAEYAGSWSVSNSQLYWPITPTSFDAIAAAQVGPYTAADNDVLAFTTDFPPMIGIRVEGTEVFKKLERVQGIAVIRYQNGAWSDHYELDVIDNADSYPSRSGLRLSRYGELLFMAYHRTDGIGDYAHTTIALSRSKDGVSWELPYLLTDNVAGAPVLLKRGDHAYLVGSDDTYRSPSVGYNGDPSVSLDITDYVVAINTRSQDIQEVQVTISNPSGVLDAQSPFSADAILQLVVSQGYTIDGTDLLPQMALVDVDAVAGAEQLPTDHIVLIGRDVLARLNMLRSDLIRDWPSQQLGGDDFSPGEDGTNYSGLRHTAAMHGHWEAIDSKLTLVSSKNPGTAFNLYVDNGWNGAGRCSIRVAANDSQDYAGIVFRGHDKDNLWVYIYNADQDQLQIVERKDGDDHVRASLGSIGWTYGIAYHLAVRFRYGKVWGYTSTDGVTYTERLVYECNGIPAGTVWSWDNIPIMMGRLGYTGYGYSNPTSPTSPGYPPLPPIFWPGPIDDPDERGDYLGVSGHGGFAWSDNALTGQPPRWSLFNTGLSDPTEAPLLCNDPNEKSRAWIVDGSAGIFRSEDWAGEEPWESVLTNAEAVDAVELKTGILGIDDLTISDLKAFDYLGDTVLFAAVNYTTPVGYSRDRVLRSLDLGDTWVCGGKIDSTETGDEQDSWWLRAPEGSGTGWNGMGEIVFDGATLYIFASIPGVVTSYGRTSAFNYSLDLGETWQTSSADGGFDGSEDFSGPACARVDSDGTLYVAPWKYSPTAPEGSSGVLEAYDLRSTAYCCGVDSTDQPTATLTLTADGTYSYDAVGWTVREGECPNNPGYPIWNIQSRMTCRITYAGGGFGFILSNQGGAKSGTFSGHDGDVLEFWVRMNIASSRCGAMVAAKMSVTGPSGDPAWEERDKAVVSAVEPTSESDLINELTLDTDDGFAERRGMLDVGAIGWVAAQIDSGGAGNSETEMYLGGGSVSTIKRPMRTLFVYDDETVFCGRSWVSGERATPTYDEVVMRSTDGACKNWSDATGALQLTSVTGIISR